MRNDTAAIKWTGAVTNIGHSCTKLQQLSRRGNPDDVLDAAMRLRAEVESLVGWLQVDIAAKGMDLIRQEIHNGKGAPIIISPREVSVEEGEHIDIEPQLPTASMMTGKQLLEASERARKRQDRRVGADLSSADLREIEMAVSPGYGGTD